MMRGTALPAYESLVISTRMVWCERGKETLTPLFARLIFGPLDWLSATGITFPLHEISAIPFIHAHVTDLFGASLVDW